MEICGKCFDWAMKKNGSGAQEEINSKCVRGKNAHFQIKDCHEQEGQSEGRQENVYRVQRIKKSVVVDALGSGFRSLVKLEELLGQTMKRAKQHIKDLKVYFR